MDGSIGLIAFLCLLKGIPYLLLSKAWVKADLLFVVGIYFWARKTRANFYETSISQIVYNTKGDSLEVTRLNGKTFSFSPRDLSQVAQEEAHPAVLYMDSKSGNKLATIERGSWVNEEVFLELLKRKH